MKGGKQVTNWEAIYKEESHLVDRYLLSLCHEEGVAEELTQETFYQAVRSAKNFDGSCRLSTWLCQIAKHLWYQELDRRRRRACVALTEDVVSAELGPEEQSALQSEKMQLMKRIHILEETAKEVVLLRLTGALSFREIGEIFGRSENWARVTFYRAKQKLTKEE